MEPKFYDLSVNGRLAQVAAKAGLSEKETMALKGDAGLMVEQADHMVENVVGVFGLPLGVAQNFVVNGREVLVPMVIEEPSVVAGASFMARLARSGGGFKAQADCPRDDRSNAAPGCGRLEQGAPGPARTQGCPAGRGRRDRPGAQAPGRRPARSGGAPDRRIAAGAVPGAAPDLRRAGCDGRQRGQYGRGAAGAAG